MHLAVQPERHEFLTAFLQRSTQTSWHDFFCANTGADADIAVNPNASRIGSTFDIISPRFDPVRISHSLLQSKPLEMDVRFGS